MKLNFENGGALVGAGMKAPLAEKILLKCPRVALVLASMGAKIIRRRNNGDYGRLAVMMAASGSIDRAGRHQKGYRFNIRLQN